MTHILQKLDIGVFKSLKFHVRVTSNMACSNNLAKYPSSVITTDVSVSMVAETYSNSFTPVNIKSGFRCVVTGNC